MAEARLSFSQAFGPTGQIQVPEELSREALNLWFDDKEGYPMLSPTEGGVNNSVQYIETSSGERYILRVYNNGNKSEKVIFEHKVLEALAKRSRDLSFMIPSAIKSKNGRAHELLSSGTEACVWELIPGTLAKTTSPEEVGRATGELSASLGSITDTLPTPAIAPYYELFKAHHGIGGDGEVFYREVATNPEFDSCRESIDYLTSEIRKCETKITKYLSGKTKLPVQLIHGDVHYDQVLVGQDNTVSGILDFEFSTFDWRAMELAVALSKYVGEADPLPLCESYVSGYVVKGQLNDAEIDAIPDLINLRIFSNVVYFTGRAIAGEDSLTSLTSRASNYAKRVKWVNANAQRLKEVITVKLLASTMCACSLF